MLSYEALQIAEKRSKRQRRKGKIYTSESSSKKLQGAIRKLWYIYTMEYYSAIKKNIRKSYTKKIFMTQITTMV